MEEAREEKKVLYEKRLERLDDSRLVKVIARNVKGSAVKEVSAG